MEGILNEYGPKTSEVQKAFPGGIMYAGRLHEKYGVMRLIEAFELLEEKDIELWLFGDGTAVREIQDYASKNPRIRYFGQVSREEILRYEQRATLLVNPRSVQDEFTQYSFPSKVIEYMHSGTPLVMTKLKGIPEEYFDYGFVVEDNRPDWMAQVLSKALSMSDGELASIGARASTFISENKSAAVQGKRIKDFLLKLSGKNI